MAKVEMKAVQSTSASTLMLGSMLHSSADIHLPLSPLVLVAIKALLIAFHTPGQFYLHLSFDFLNYFPPWAVFLLDSMAVLPLAHISGLCQSSVSSLFGLLRGKMGGSCALRRFALKVSCQQ